MRRPPLRRRPASERRPDRRRSPCGLLVVAALFVATVTALSLPRVAAGVAVGATVVAVTVRYPPPVPTRPSERHAPPTASRPARDRGSRSP